VSYLQIVKVEEVALAACDPLERDKIRQKAAHS
jgi:hypothetical protein